MTQTHRTNQRICLRPDDVLSTDTLTLRTFTARRYASAVFAVVVCQSVRPSIRHKSVLYGNDWTNRAGFWQGGFLPHIPDCYKEIWVSPETRVLHSGTLSQTSDLKISSSKLEGYSRSTCSKQPRRRRRLSNRCRQQSRPTTRPRPTFLQLIRL